MTDNDKVKCKFCGVERKNILMLIAHVKNNHPGELKKISKERKDFYSKWRRKLENFKQ